MTPAQLEHLKLIDSHLERLLAIAEKRTPGEWESSRIFGDWGFAHVDQITTRMHRPENDGLGITLNYGGVIQCVGSKDKRNEQSKADSTFIASCAGNAEAGWRATRTAIAALSKIAKEKEPVEHGDSGDGPYTSMFRTSAAIFAKQQLESILAAFPVELIQKP